MILINNDIYEVSKFPNGEMKMPKINLTEDQINIVWKYEGEEELVTLYFIKKHLEEMIFEKNKKCKIDLTIPYLPYSRMDRVKSKEEVFTLKYICEFINSLMFNKVCIFEPHSDVSLALLNRCEKKDLTKLLFEEYSKEYSINDLVVCFPDAGAQKRYDELNKKGYKTVVGFKKRNWETGRIESLDLLGDDVNNKIVYILDDLCSFGGTFMLTASKLKELGAKKIILVVTHCEKNILLGEITKNNIIDKVICTNSIINKNDVLNDKFLVQEVI